MEIAPPLEAASLEQAFGLYRLARMLHAVASLGIADLLADGPVSAAELAKATETHEESLAAVLNTLTGWGVFARDEERRYGLTPVSQRLRGGLAESANKEMLLGWTGFSAVYEAFGSLLHTLRTGESGSEGAFGMGFHEYLASRPDLGGLYGAAMESTTEAFAHDVAAYDFSGASLVVDVGGGQGSLSLEILARYPSIRAISFDLPEVISAANTNVLGHPRLKLVAGDAFVSVPPGGDIYTTSTVLRCFDDERCQALLRNIRSAMPASARLVAFEYVMPNDRDDLLMNTADLTARVVYGGHDRTLAEFEGLFRAASLKLNRSKQIDGPKHWLEAVAAEPA